MLPPLNERLLNGASSWLNRRGHRGRVQNIVVAESKTLRLGLVMAEWKRSRGRMEAVAWSNGRHHSGQFEGPLIRPHHGQIEEGAKAEWNTSPLSNRRTSDWASSWSNRRGHRGQMEDITTTRLKALRLGLFMAELEPSSRLN